MEAAKAKAKAKVRAMFGSDRGIEVCTGVNGLKGFFLPPIAQSQGIGTPLRFDLCGHWDFQQ